MRAWLMIGVAGIWAGHLYADTHTWDGGGGGDINWTSGANWDNSDTAPAGTDSAVFDGGTGGNVGVATGSPAISNVSVGGTAAWTWTDTGTLFVTNLFTYGSSGNSKYYARLGGPGSLLVTSGELVMTNANTFSGVTTVSGGRLGVDSSTALSTGLVSLGTAGIGAYSASRTLANPVSLDGNVTFGSPASPYCYLTLAGPITLTGNRTLYTVSDGNGGRSVTLAGPITDGVGSYSLSYAGTAGLTLSGSNTFDGGVILAGGTLEIGHDQCLGTGPLTLQGGVVAGSVGGRTVANPVVLNGSIQIGAGGAGSPVLTFAGGATLAGSRTITVSSDANGACTARFNGALGDGVRVFGLTKSGGGILALYGDNAFQGGIRSLVGTLLLNGNNDSMSGALVLYSGTLQAVARSSGSPLGPKAVSLADGAGTLRLDGVNGVADTAIASLRGANGSPLIYVNGVAGGGTWTAGSLVRENRAVLVFKGNGGSSSLGGNDKFMVVQEPAVVNGMVAPWLLETTGDFLAYDGSSVGFKRATYSPFTDVNLVGGATIFNATVGQTLTADRDVYALKSSTGSGIDGAYDLTVHSGGVILNASQPVNCNLQFNGKENVLWVNSGATATLNGLIKGTNGLTKAGAGTLTLVGDSHATLTGPVTVNGGTLTFGASAVLPEQDLALNNANMNLNGTSQTCAGLIMAGGTLYNSSTTPAILSLANYIVYRGVYNSSVVRPDSGKSLTLNLTGPTTFQIDAGPAGGSLLLGGYMYVGGWGPYYVNMTGTGDTPIRKRGAGYLQYYNNQTNTCVGDISIEDGLLLGSGYQVFGSPSNKVFLSRSGIIGFGAGAGVSLADVSFSGGNGIKGDVGQSGLSIFLASLTRVPGSRGTLLLLGSWTSVAYYNDFDNNLGLYVNGFKSPDPNVNGMLPAYLVVNGYSADLGQASFCKANTSNGRVSRYTAAVTSISGGSPTDPVYLAGTETLAASREIWALRTAVNVGKSGDPTLTLGSGGLILNGDLVISPKLRFGSSGTGEALVYVSGSTYATRTAELAGSIVTTGGLTKMGAGTLVLSADNSSTLSGDFHLHGGTVRLAATNALAAATTINLERGTTLEMAGNLTLTNVLSGSGTLIMGTNMLTVGASGQLAPGFSSGLGTLNIDNLDFRGTCNWEYDSLAADRVQVDTLTFGSGSATLWASWIGDGNAPTGSYPVISYNGPDPAEPMISVRAPSKLGGRAWLDTTNRCVMVTFFHPPRGTIVILR